MMKDARLILAVLGSVVMLATILMAAGQIKKTVSDNTNDVEEVEAKVEAVDERLHAVEKKQGERQVDVDHVKKTVDANSAKLDKILERLP